MTASIRLDYLGSWNGRSWKTMHRDAGTSPPAMPLRILRIGVEYEVSYLYEDLYNEAKICTPQFCIVMLVK